MSDIIYQSEEACFTAYCGKQPIGAESRIKRRSLQITPLHREQYVQLTADEVKELIKSLVEEYI